MSKRKSTPPRITIAPEYSGRASLAKVLGQSNASPPPVQAPEDSSVWTVLGVSALWQTAAENAARRTGVDLGDWLRQTINEAVTAEGITLTAAD